jgi:hypothetical protein
VKLACDPSSPDEAASHALAFTCPGRFSIFRTIEEQKT